MTSYFGLLPPSVLPYIPSFDYVLIDLSAILERLPAFASDYAKLTGVLLQNSRQKRLLERALREIGDSINRLLAEDRGERFFKTSLLYLTWAASLTKGEAVIIFRTVSEQAENYNMSLYEQLIREGREQGIEQGREQGFELALIRATKAMFNLRMDASAIAAALEVPLDQVKTIIKQIENE